MDSGGCHLLDLISKLGKKTNNVPTLQKISKHFLIRIIGFISFYKKDFAPTCIISYLNVFLQNFFKTLTV